ncbi:MAG: Uma2 family endonuclease [Pirellulales bacterium]
MSATAPPLVTAEELWLRPDDGLRHELVRGELRTMTPAGSQHGLTIGYLHTLLGPHIKQRQLGHLFGAETGFVIFRGPDTVRAPDLAFICRDRAINAVPAGYFPGAPDLAIEVLSPNDRARDVDEKVQDWLRAGCREVWVVSPRLKTVAIHRSNADVRVLSLEETLESPELLPGFTCQVSEVFGA